jgi:hypothetical protein
MRGRGEAEKWIGRKNRARGIRYILCAIQISALSASQRFKKDFRTGKRRGAEERRGCAVGEKDWRGRGWDGRSSGRDFLFYSSRLQISAFSASLRFKEDPADR